VCSGDKSRGVCPACGVVETQAIRRALVSPGKSVVPDMLVDVCVHCGQTVGWPKQSAGRLFAAAVKKHRVAEIFELRMPPEAVDLALSIHAALGVVPKGDIFALPIQLGLVAVARDSTPNPNWAILEDRRLASTCRARPSLTKVTTDRITGLRRDWGCESDASVVRRLIVAAYFAYA
jgi:hypothetical protein